MVNRILVYVVVACVVFASGAWLGYDYRDGKVAQEIVDAVVDAFEVANEDADAERERAVAAAKEEQRRAASVREAKLAAQLNAAQESSASCLRSERAIRLLNDLIDRANGKAYDPPSLLERMRTDTKADSR